MKPLTPIQILINPETSFKYLIDSWRRAEQMKRHWMENAKAIPKAHTWLINCQMLLEKIEAEAHRRIEAVSIDFIIGAIETGCQFTINL